MSGSPAWKYFDTINPEYWSIHDFLTYVEEENLDDGSRPSSHFNSIFYNALRKVAASQDKNSEMYVAAAKLLKDLRGEKRPRDDDDEQETQIVRII